MLAFNDFDFGGFDVKYMSHAVIFTVVIITLFRFVLFFFILCVRIRIEACDYSEYVKTDFRKRYNCSGVLPHIIQYIRKKENFFHLFILT